MSGIMRKRIFILCLLTILLLVGCENDPEGLAPPKELSSVGQAYYTSAPISLSQLNSGLQLDKGWNAFIWTDEVEESISVSDALKSIKDDYYYIYKYNERRYYFNPNQIYAKYNDHPYYKTRLVSKL